MTLKFPFKKSDIKHSCKHSCLLLYVVLLISRGFDCVNVKTCFFFFFFFFFLYCLFFFFFFFFFFSFIKRNIIWGQIKKIRGENKCSNVPHWKFFFSFLYSFPIRFMWLETIESHLKIEIGQLNFVERHKLNLLCFITHPR